MTVQSDCQPSRQALVISSFVLKWSDFSTCHPPVSVSYHCPGHSLCNFLCVVIKWWLSDWKWLLKLNLSFSQNILFKKKKKGSLFRQLLMLKKELFYFTFSYCPGGCLGMVVLPLALAWDGVKHRGSVIVTENTGMRIWSHQAMSQRPTCPLSCISKQGSAQHSLEDFGNGHCQYLLPAFLFFFFFNEIN